MSFITIDRLKVTNHLLKQLVEDTHAVRARHIERLILLPVREFLVVPNHRTKFVYFAEPGIVSVVTADASGQSVEVGQRGREANAGDMSSSKRTAHQPAPTCRYEERGSEFQLLRLRRFSPRVRRHTLFSCGSCSICQSSSSSALTNARYDVPARLDRWLPMSNDRFDTETFR